MSQFNTEKAFEVIQKQLQQIQNSQESHQQSLSEHAGVLAEVLHTVKRLDEERLVEHHRLQQVIEDVRGLKQALNASTS